MTKTMELSTRKQNVILKSKSLRNALGEIIDEMSLVEMDTYSFSRSTALETDIEGDGVITGFCTIADYPFYVVAQNFEVLSGGLTVGQTTKILKCLEKAEKSNTPILYMLNSRGILYGEGIPALEGLSKIIKKCNDLKSEVMQICVLDGELYGSLAVLPAMCDFTIMTKKGTLGSSSPLVISAKSNKNLPASEILSGEIHSSKTGACEIVVEDLKGAKDSIAKILSIIPETSEIIEDEKVDLNSTVDFNGDAEKIFDKGDFIEIYKGYSSSVKFYIGRIGGISTAVLSFVNKEEGVELCPKKIRGIRRFYDLVADLNMPLINLVNAKGIESSIGVEQSDTLKGIGDLVLSLSLIDAGKIALVYGKAVGLGYSLFASKSMDYDFVLATENSEIALFDKTQGAMIEYGKEMTAENKAELENKYFEEKSNPYVASELGGIDNVILDYEVRQYLIATLQTLIR